MDYSYDAAGRMTGQVWKNSGGTVTNIVTYTYDNADRLLTARDGQGAYTFTYDAIGQVITQKDLWSTTLTYTYDSVGNRTNVVDNFAGLETSTYNAVNLLATRKFSGIGSTQLRTDLTYTSRNERDTINRYSDLTASTKIGSTSFTYDAIGELTNLIYRNGAGTVLSNFTYTYDASGRITLENLGGTLTTFAYNSRNLITDDSYHTYTWDNASNRTSNSATYGTGNRLASDNSFTYTYDDEGNLITKVSVGGPTVTWTYDYDVNNRLVSIIETGGGTELYRTTYTYDVFNRRIKEVEDADGAGSGTTAIETRFSYDRNRIWADLDNTNALKVRYVRDEESGELFARVKANGDTAWYYADVWGSTRQMVDNTGALKDTILYDSFGNVQSETDAAFGDRWKWLNSESNLTVNIYMLGAYAYQTTISTIANLANNKYSGERKIGGAQFSRGNDDIDEGPIYTVATIGIIVSEDSDFIIVDYAAISTRASESWEAVKGMAEFKYMTIRPVLGDIERGDPKLKYPMPQSPEKPLTWSDGPNGGLIGGGLKGKIKVKNPREDGRYAIVVEILQNPESPQIRQIITIILTKSKGKTSIEKIDLRETRIPGEGKSKWPRKDIIRLIGSDGWNGETSKPFPDKPVVKK